MRTTMTVLFVIAMLISSTQSFRHIYVKWIQPTSSVLDEFKDKAKIKAESTKSMDELIELYREAKKDVESYEDNKNNPKIVGYKQRSIEPYKSATSIQREITDREHDNRTLSKLKFYWFTGLLSLIAGLFVLTKFNAWLGFSGIVVGISEMLVWTSPLFFNKALHQQFTSLLNYKLTLSIITWLIIVNLWVLIDGRNLIEKYINNKK